MVGWESWDRSRRGGEARAEVRGLEERVVLVLNLDLRFLSILLGPIKM